MVSPGEAQLCQSYQVQKYLAIHMKNSITKDKNKRKVTLQIIILVHKSLSSFFERALNNYFEVFSFDYFSHFSSVFLTIFDLLNHPN